MNIINKPTATIEQVYAWLDTKNPHPLAKAMVSIFFEKAIKEGIDPIVVIAQAMKETGYFKFQGVLRPNFCNTCGLKGNLGGGDYDPNAHIRFDYWEDGIQAHIDHIALYAGASSYPRYGVNCPQAQKEEYKVNGTTLDPRHFGYLKGKCPTVESLSGNWAPSKTYGEDIVKMCNEISSTIVVKDECSHKEYEDKIVNLQSDIEELSIELSSAKNIVEQYNKLKQIIKEMI